MHHSLTKHKKEKFHLFFQERKFKYNLLLISSFSLRIRIVNEEKSQALSLTDAEKTKIFGFGTRAGAGRRNIEDPSFLQEMHGISLNT